METFAVDSSVLVKWFKKGEDFENEALKLRQDILSSKVKVLVSELTILEVCRALIKVGYPVEKVKEAYATLSDMEDLDFLRSAPTVKLRSEAKDLMVELNLYVADALHLAVATVNFSNLLTEDRHLLKREVKEFMRKKELKIIRLKEMY